MHQALAQALRAQGMDVITMQEAGMLEAPDEEQLTWATDQAGIVYLPGTGFRRLHKALVSQGGSHG